jgi:2-dehydro-3-deoxygluconokinase
MVQFIPVAGDIQHSAEFVAQVAGAESNTAIGLARLGRNVAWASRVGSDALGERVISALERAGVDTSLVEIDTRRPTGVMFKAPAGDNRDVFYLRAGSAASAISERIADAACRRRPRFLFVSGITPALSEQADAAVTKMIGLARRYGATVCVDVNYRASLWEDKSRAGERLLEIARSADIVLVGLDEASEIWGAPVPVAVRKLLGGVELIVKDAPRRVTAFFDGERHLEMSLPEVKVVESVGAGDAFAAGYLHGRLANWTLEKCLLAGHVLAEAALRSTSDTSPMTERELLVGIARGAYRR